MLESEAQRIGVKFLPFDVKHSSAMRSHGQAVCLTSDSNLKRQQRTSHLDLISRAQCDRYVRLDLPPVYFGAVRASQIHHFVDIALPINPRVRAADVFIVEMDVVFP